MEFLLAYDEWHMQSTGTMIGVARIMYQNPLSQLAF